MNEPANEPNQPTQHQKIMAEILAPMQAKLKRDMLKFHVGRVIFCPSCQNILDCRRSVEVDLIKDGHFQKSWIMCATCWDTKAKPAINPETMSRLEVNDGRELFGRRKRSKS